MLGVVESDLIVSLLQKTFVLKVIIVGSNGTSFSFIWCVRQRYLSLSGHHITSSTREIHICEKLDFLFFCNLQFQRSGRLSSRIWDRPTFNFAMPTFIIRLINPKAQFMRISWRGDPKIHQEVHSINIKEKKIRTVLFPEFISTFRFPLKQF